MIRIAFAGFRHGHINALYQLAKNNSGIEVVGAYEIDKETRETVEKNLGVKFTHDKYEDLLKEENIDVIAIGDYFSIRGSMVIKALKAGKHVFADKPLCTSLEELDEIENLAVNNGLKIGCMLDMRYNVKTQVVRNYLREGKLGKIHAIYFGGQHPLLYGSRPSWYFEEGKHGGTINDIAIHGIDYLEHIANLSLVKVIGARCWNGFADREPNFRDCGQFMAELTDGVGLVADVSYSAPNSSGYTLPFYWRFTIWGTKGVMEFSATSKDIIVALDGSPGVESITIPEGDGGDCLKVFVDELKGKPTDIDTESVIRVSRNTLKIQEFADRT